MGKQSWKKLIFDVLNESEEPLHYTEISERILSRKRKSTYRARPALTVNAEISKSINREHDKSPFIRVGTGIFTVRGRSRQSQSQLESAVSEGIIRSFGMYWQRDKVVWRRHPRLYGLQQAGAKSVDFSEQRGIYILYDHHSVIYVGRVTDR